MEQQPKTSIVVGFPYAEAENRMRQGLKVKREKWPDGMVLGIEDVDGEPTTVITQPPRKVPIVLHALDTNAIDWIEAK